MKLRSRATTFFFYVPRQVTPMKSYGQNKKTPITSVFLTLTSAIFDTHLGNFWHLPRNFWHLPRYFWHSPRKFLTLTSIFLTFTSKIYAPLYCRLTALKKWFRGKVTSKIFWGKCEVESWGKIPYRWGKKYLAIFTSQFLPYLLRYFTSRFTS